MKKLIIIMLLSSCIKSLNNLNVINKDNINEKLINACREGNANLVTSLLEQRANINYKDNNGNTALIVASENGHKEAVELLIGRGANVNDKDNKGETALMYASRYGHKKIVELLLEKGTDIDIKDNLNRTALMTASCNGHTEIVRVLLEKGSNINEKNHDRSTSLLWALANCHTETARILLEKGANVNDKNNEGNIALIFVSKKMKGESLSKEEENEYIDIAYILIEEMKRQLSLLNSYFIPTSSEERTTKESKNVSTNIELNKYLEKSIELFDFLLHIPRDLFIYIIKFIN